MKKIELNASKLQLQKEKITDLNDSKNKKNGDGPNVQIPTTTVWDHTKIPILCV
jgi:hypothetical protein